MVMLRSLIIALITGGSVVAFQGSAVTVVEIKPGTAEVRAGQQMTFTAVGRDASGRQVAEAPNVWFAAPSDVAAADASGIVTFYKPGEVKIGAMIGGKTGFTTVIVKPAPVERIELTPPAIRLFKGSVARIAATPRTINGDPRTDASISWSSDNPSVATADPGGLVIAAAPGKCTITARADGAVAHTAVEVSANPVRRLAVEPRTASARTGDVIRFKAKATSNADAAVNEPPVRWAVTGDGAFIEPDGAFFAERPGSYLITAVCGEVATTSSVVVTPRHVEREIDVVGRGPVKDFQAAEQWILGNYVYVSTISDKLLVYDISNPSKPKLTDTVTVDARLVNDVSTTADGRIGVLTREGASNRKNGIVFLDTSDPAHPKVVSEYTETVTGGVHSAYVDGHYVYLTDDATGSLRVIDFNDVKKPREVARWEAPNPLAKPVRNPLGDEAMGGRYLHDVQVKDGLAYLGYWRDGLVILDVGAGIKGGSPENPKFVSQLRFNYHELYGDGWMAGAHAIYRYKNYVFIGDEVFPGEFDIQSRTRIPVRGIVHVVDVSDIMNPRKVAEYNVPEGGAHNMWVEDDILYMGYYSGGGRILDVSGEMRGDLYRQGREIARVWTGDPEGYRPNLPFTWGAQPYRGMVFFNDINSGLWIVKLGKPKYKGSTTAPGY